MGYGYQMDALLLRRARVCGQRALFVNEVSLGGVLLNIGVELKQAGELLCFVVMCP